jgi:predicted transcriptional regulator with HTH domain
VGALARLVEKLLDLATRLPIWWRDRKRKRILFAMLSQASFEWRSLETLARAVGADAAKTRELLVAIRARASTGAGREVWGLIERVGQSGIREDI